MIDKLTLDMEGSYIITTQNTQHKWNNTGGVITYSRHPFDQRNSFWSDGREFVITHVDTWPKVGGKFLIYFDDPDIPLQVEHWRISSTIETIERAT